MASPPTSRVADGTLRITFGSPRTSRASSPLPYADSAGAITTEEGHGEEEPLERRVKEVFSSLDATNISEVPKGAIVAALRADEVVGEVLGLPVEELEGMGLGEVRERMQELVRVLEADGDGTITMQELEVAISYASRAPLRLQGWTLHEHVIGEEIFLLDCATGRVYTRESHSAPPRLAGQLTEEKGGAGGIDNAPTPLAFAGDDDLAAALARRVGSGGPAGLGEILKSFDKAGAGPIAPRDFTRLLMELLPGLHPSEGAVRYLAVMLDATGDGKLYTWELAEVLDGWRRHGFRLPAKEQPGLEDVAGKMRLWAVREEKEARDLFDLADADGDGLLTVGEVRQLIRIVMPACNDSELRLLTTAFMSLDSDGDGRIEYGDLDTCLALLDVIIVPLPGDPKP